MVDALTKLAITYGTDKFGYHDYTPNYYKLLKHLKNRPIKLLEIGVGGYQDADRGGESLEVWRDFFPKAQIVGIDIQKKEMDLGERVSILQGSQVDAEFLETLVRDHGPFDVIIDDGSHRNEHVVTSFQLLYPTLAEGGIYVVEDVQTAFFPRFGGSLEMTAPNSVGYFADMVRKFDSDRADVPADITTISRFHNMIAMHKGQAGQATDLKAMFKPLKDAPVRLLEISPEGVSLAGWRDYFAEGQITGIATGEQADDLGPRVQVVKASKPSLKDIKKLRSDFGPFDIVIDNTGHKGDSVKMFEALWPGLNDTGYYVLTGADAAVADFAHDRFVEVDHREMQVFFPEVEVNPVARQIYEMTRSKGLITLYKAPNDYPSNFRFEFDNPQAVHALDEMEKVLNRSGKERGFLLFADIMTRGGDDKRAAKMLKKLAALGASSRSYFNMAVRQAKIDKDWDGAMVLLRMAVKTYPDDYRIRSQLGSVFSKEKEWEKAEKEFVRGIELAPKDPLLRIQLANALSRLDRPDEAVLAASSACELVPAHVGHRVQLGRLQSNAGQFEAAVETLNQAVALDGEMANAHRQLSRALAELGRNSEALEVADKALALVPENPEYKRWQERLRAA